MDDKPIWQAIDKLRERQNIMGQQMEAMRSEIKIQREVNLNIMNMLSRIEGKIEAVQTDYHKAAGGLAVGKWIAAVVVGLSGAGVAIWSIVR